MNNKIAFCTVAVWSKNYDNAYLDQQDTLVDSIRRIYWNREQAEIFQWRDCYPPGSRDWLSSSYGFKCHAIKFALDQGYQRVVYMDTAMILKKKLDLDHLVPEHGMIAIKDDSNLMNVTSDLACQYFGVTREWLNGKNLVGGSFYYLNADNPKAMTIFNQWIEAEKNDVFGSQDLESAGKQQGHRHDESSLAICLYLNNSKPCTYEQIGYQGETMVKRHFR